MRGRCHDDFPAFQRLSGLGPLLVIGGVKVIKVSWLTCTEHKSATTVIDAHASSLSPQYNFASHKSYEIFAGPITWTSVTLF